MKRAVLYIAARATAILSNNKIDTIIQQSTPSIARHNPNSNKTVLDMIKLCLLSIILKYEE